MAGTPPSRLTRSAISGTRFWCSAKANVAVCATRSASASHLSNGRWLLASSAIARSNRYCPARPITLVICGSSGLITVPPPPIRMLNG